MLKGMIFLNDLIVFLLHCPAVIGQVLLKLLEARHHGTPVCVHFGTLSRHL
jgi:hypothetical protein